VATWTDPIFGLHVPQHIPEVPLALLCPRETWADPTAYDHVAAELAARFRANIARFEDIAATVAKWTGIPVTRLLEGEVQKLVKMEDRLGQRVV